jgi:hypothetical protein
MSLIRSVLALFRRGETHVPFALELADVHTRRDDAVSQLFYSNTGAVVHKWDNYLPVYARHFEPFRGRGDANVLEIGVYRGGSLELWRKYFGRSAMITGIDIDPGCAKYDGLAGAVRIGSQNDLAFLRQVVAERGRPDIVIDDGSHIAKHIRASFDVLFPLLKDGGLYVAEDLHTSYWRSFGGGLRRRGSFIEHVKRLMDDMHSWYHPRASQYADPEMGIVAIHVYDSIVVIEKGRKQRPFHVKTGA